MGGKSSPPPPDYGPLAKQAEKAADLAYQASREQLSFARERWGEQQELLQRVLDTQLPIMEEQFRTAQADRQRYEELYQPLEEDLIQEFQTFDTEERRRAEAGRAISDVTQAFEAQRENAQRRLESYGVDPSQTRSQALDLGVRAQQAASQAAAGTQASQRVEDIGRSLRAEAINIGKGMPSQVAASYGQSIQAGQAAIGGQSQAIGTQTGARTAATGFMGQGTSAIGAGTQALNTGFQNQLAGKQFEAQWGIPGMAMTGAGIAAGMM